ERKRVGSYGVRVESDGTTLIPMRTLAGELASLQLIKADGEKRFLPGAPARDLLHWLGSPDDASSIAIAEGYATAATIHGATGLPVACAFNAGNLPGIARMLRERFR